MEKYKLITKLSQMSNKYGDKLIDFMNRYNLNNLQQATVEQLKEYLASLQQTEEIEIEME